MPDIATLCTDLAAEHSALDDVVAPLSPHDWDLVTPAEPWTVRDQITHLTFFDRAAARVVSDPDGFAEELGEAAADISGYMDGPLLRAKELDPEDVLARWRAQRRSMLAAFGEVDPASRIPWYGPPMSPASFISARLMETWAHGQDIVDTIGVTRQPTDRLAHIAHLGVRARRFSYVANSLDFPGGEIRVQLSAPSGESWTWGDEGAEDRVSGSALGFCLLVTQRRHIDDVDVEASGPLASEWLSIAQCFAGPPGEGRRSGQFAKLTS